MHNRYLSFIAAVAVIVVPQCIAAQSLAPRIAGLEADTAYMNLLRRAQQLKNGEDSIVRVIDAARSQFASAAEAQKEQLGTQILQFEKELFNIRNQEGLTANKIGVIEQDFVMKNLNGSTAQPAPQPSEPAATPKGKQHPNLVYNTYFKDNLQPQDYQTLLKAQQREIIPGALIATYLSNYHQIDSLNRMYDTLSNRHEAEGMYERIASLQHLNQMAEDSLNRVWSYIFDNKTYSYNYLLDKMGKSEALKKFDESYRKNRQAVAAMQDSVQSTTVYGYQINKHLLQDYEQTVAGLLGYTAAKDSIARQSQYTAQLQCNLPKINVAERNFIQYSNIERNTTKYSTAHPIPELEIFRRGTVYRIRLGSFGQKQPASIFKGVSPLYYTKSDDRYTYYAGGFRTQDEAEQAWNTLKEEGLRNPEIVYWHDGTLENAGTPGEQSVFYRVEITGQGEQLSDAIRAIATEKAEGKDFTRSSEADGSYVYSIGNFSKKQLAESLCEAINQIAAGSASLRTLDNE